MLSNVSISGIISMTKSTVHIFSKENCVESFQKNNKFSSLVYCIILERLFARNTGAVVWWWDMIENSKNSYNTNDSEFNTKT